jgi:peptidoglycan/xylan/chitin deacetylase (PgdA/CDA1 family)
VLPPKAVVITIDDAYRSIYEVAYPIFQQYGFPFTVFVATDPVDYALPAYMNWGQMREMAGKGVTFANHGASHCSAITKLKNESDFDRITRVIADFRKGRNRLGQELTPLPNVFAYPYGEYDSKVSGLLLKEGYISFGQQSGAVGSESDPRALPRFPMAEAFADIDEFRVKVNSLPMPVKKVTPWEPVVNDARPEIELTLSETLERVNELACFISSRGRVKVRWIEKGRRFSVHPPRDLGAGRQRVNCTVPRNDGRYYWFSHPWFVNINNP